MQEQWVALPKQTLGPIFKDTVRRLYILSRPMEQDRKPRNNLLHI